MSKAVRRMARSIAMFRGWRAAYLPPATISHAYGVKHRVARSGKTHPPGFAPSP